MNRRISWQKWRQNFDMIFWKIRQCRTHAMTHKILIQLRSDSYQNFIKNIITPRTKMNKQSHLTWSITSIKHDYYMIGRATWKIGQNLVILVHKYCRLCLPSAVVEQEKEFSRSTPLAAEKRMRGMTYLITLHPVSATSFIHKNLL